MRYSLHVGLILQAISFALSIIRIKYLTDGYSAEDYGFISIYFSVVSLFSIITIFNTDRYIFRLGADSPAEARKVLPSLLFLPIIFGGFSFFYFNIDSKFANFEWIASVNVIVIGAFHLIRFYLLGINRLNEYSILSFMMTNFWFIMLMGCDFLGIDASLYTVLKLMLGSHFLLFSYSCMVAIWREKILLNFEETKIKCYSAISYSIGFLPLILSTRIIELGDKYIVNLMVSAKEMGLLIMANSIVAAVNAVTSIIADLFRRKFTSIKDDREFMRFSERFLLLGLIVVGLACMVFHYTGPVIFDKIISKNFNGASEYAEALIPSCFLTYLSTYCVNILERYKKSQWVGISYIISGVIYVPISYLLIYVFQVRGAIYSIYAINVFLVLILLWKNYRFLYPIFKSLLIILPISFVIFNVMEFVGEMYKTWTVISVCGLAMWYAQNLIKKTEEK